MLSLICASERLLDFLLSPSNHDLINGYTANHYGWLLYVDGKDADLRCFWCRRFVLWLPHFHRPEVKLAVVLDELLDQHLDIRLNLVKAEVYGIPRCLEVSSTIKVIVYTPPSTSLYIVETISKRVCVGARTHPCSAHGTVSNHESRHRPTTSNPSQDPLELHPQFWSIVPQYPRPGV